MNLKGLDLAFRRFRLQLGEHREGIGPGIRRRDFGHIDLQMTIDDRKAYTKPWTVNLGFDLADTELIEYVCDENEKDVGHLVGK